MNRIFLVLFSLLLIISCNKEDLPSDIPNCIGDKIQDIADGDPWIPAAKIYKYNYNNQTVYYFPAHCCDVPSKVYDSNCNLICSPDGGLTGSGDGLCNDFFASRTNEELIWEDN
jgi:hypothetical protein